MILYPKKHNEMVGKGLDVKLDDSWVHVPDTQKLKGLDNKNENSNAAKYKAVTPKKDTGGTT